MGLILIKSESRFPVDRKRIKKKIEKTLVNYGVFSVAEVSIAFVGPQKMRQLNRDFRRTDEVTSVLSFSQIERGKQEDQLIASPDGVLRLGDVIVCYEEAQKRADEGGKMVDEEVDFLVEHGLLHLLGVHHD